MESVKYYWDIFAAGSLVAFLAEKFGIFDPNIIIDSIADSVFVKMVELDKHWVSVSEQKISITILILKRGPCLQEGRGNQIIFTSL